MIWRLLLLAAATLFATSPASADELRPGLLSFEQRSETRWDVAWKEPLSAASDPAISDRLPELPKMCAFEAPPVTRMQNQALIGNGAIICEGSLSGSLVAYSALAPNAEMLVRVQPLGAPVQMFRLTARAPTVSIAEQAATPPVWSTYIGLGFEHILEGWDHLLFVIALVLLVFRWKAVAIAVTAFTVAHSVTLAATTLGFIGLPARAVEAVIALSILLLALELVRGRSDSLTIRYPWAVAFVFGLIHGFGFAGALREIGLPEGDVASALLAFNIGVEAGQLAVVALVLALRGLLARFAPQFEAPALKFAAYLIGITSAYWLITRLIG